MSGIALSSLLLLCVLIPGLVCLHVYLREIAGAKGGNPTVEITAWKTLVTAVLVSIAFHVAWGVSLSLVQWLISVVSPSEVPLAVDYRTILKLIGGDTRIVATAAVSIGTLVGFSVYLWSQFVAAVWLGTEIANQMLGADGARDHWLSDDGAMWHRLFKFPEGNPYLILVTVTVSYPEATYLYIGGLEHYELTPNGMLRYLHLRAAYRRQLADDGDDAEYYEIPGDELVIDCENVQTVDVEYFYDVDSEADAPSESTDTTRGILRSWRKLLVG